MVYDHASVAFRYPTPTTPGDSPVNGSSAVQPKTEASPASHGLAVPTPQATSTSTPKISSKKSTPKSTSSKARKVSNGVQGASKSANKQAHAENSSRIEIQLPMKKELEASASDTVAHINASQTSGTAGKVATQPTPVPVPSQHPQLDNSNIPQPEGSESSPAIATPSAAQSTTITPSQKADDTPAWPSRPPAATQIAVELPNQKTFDKTEFMLVPDLPDEPDEPANLSSRKRKRGGLDRDELYGESLDQRQRATAAYHDLQRTVQTIFEAETQVIHSHTGNETVMLTRDGEPTISASTQQKLQSQLSKTISLNCFESVPLDDLLRILRLSEPALKYAEGLEIRLDVSWGEGEVQQWVQQFPEIEMGLKAARTAFRMMCGGREDKQLSSENMIQLALDLFKHVLDGIIIPVAELRQSGSSEIFKLVSSQKKRISALLFDSQKLFSLMSEVIAKIDTSDTVTNTLEFAATRLIFLESAFSEKESVLETQKFDTLRLVAMDMLSQIFLANPAQRQGIFDEILTSLEKLPVTKQRASKFKLMDGTSIQPVSALIMRLVQSSAGKVDDRKSNRQEPKIMQTMEDGEMKLEQVPNGNTPGFTIRNEEHAATQNSTAVQELQSLVTPLMDTARRNASYVIHFIVNRAMKSTKSGDAPYRNLLDLFVDDFASCLANPDWPAAELLLEMLMARMVKLVDGEKTSAPAKNMALEILGSMGAAISNLRGQVRKTANTPEANDAGELSDFLASLALSALELQSRPEHLVSWTGPFRATLEYLEDRFADDPHLTSAISFLICDWARRICSAYDSFDDEKDGRDQEFGRLAYRLREMTTNRTWLTDEYSFRSVSLAQARFSYAVTLLRSPLCEQFNGIVNILLNSMASDQATVRSKSLKSVNQVLETDPSILDGDSVVVQLILKCLNDSSTQVRDSALGLIGKCIAVRPNLEEHLIPTVIDRFIDTGPGVRKRAMKLARDIYLRNEKKTVRSSIASGLLLRMQDPEESVRDLAKQMIEEIWFTPFQNGESSAVSQTSLTEHVALMVQTVKHGSVTAVLDKVLQAVLSPESKTAQPNFEVCQRLVASMFDLVDSPDFDDPSLPSGRDALQVLVFFSKAEAKLFTFEQVRLLKPYIESIQTSEDGAMSRAVVVIYRRVLPQLSKAHAPFLADIRKDLLPAVGKATRALLDDIVACLWIISTLLGTSEHLARLVLSSLTGLQKMRAMTLKQPVQDLVVKKFTQYSLIVGMAGKHCDLDSHLELFQKSFPKWSGTTISKLMVDVVIPFTAPEQPLEIRKAALDAVGLVCQASPRNYVSASVYTTFQKVFESQIPVLESMILRSFREFLLTEEKRSEGAAKGEGAANGGGKRGELTVMGGTTYDDVASATTQRFLGQITRIALSTLDDHAYLGVELLASINRQGLVHPKETGVTFMTLETSPHPRISELAYIEHKSLHEKHETVVEREYVKALQSAFAYQRDVVKDPHGANTNPFASKLNLLTEVLKISKSKNRQRFLEKVCSQINFDPSKLDASGAEPQHVQYSRFLLENIAFFDYVTVGEVQTTVAALEKTFTSTGANVAQAIESEVFQVRMDAIDQESTGGGAPVSIAAAHPLANPARVRQLAAASVILMALWEARTYLRRLYSLGSGRGKSQPKDLARAPIKTQGITGDKFWEDVSRFMNSLTSVEAMTATCHAFVDLMNVDKEFTIPNEGEAGDGEDPATPENEGDDMDDQPGTGRGRKRKASITPGSGKKKIRASSQPRKRGRPRKNPIEVQDADGEFEEDTWF